jgi:hypothetical protein
MRMANFTPERVEEVRAAFAERTAAAKGETTT